jgi:hypothetical protein
MGKPIKNTPVLYGKDAEIFLQNALSVPNEMQKKKEQERIEKSLKEFELLLSELNIE